jgi:hypothetical protein
MMRPSPWLQRQRWHERRARHTRFRNSVEASVLRLALGAAAGAAVVLALQFFGVLPK